MNGLDENMEAADEAANPGGKFGIANTDDCPEVKLNPTLGPPNCVPLAKPTLPPKTEACAGGSPGGGGGLTNGTENAADEAEAGFEGDGNLNGLLEIAGEPMESPA